jgi:endonuclease YncB( thermonuclease family)
MPSRSCCARSLASRVLTRRRPAIECATADGWDYSVEAARAGAAHSYVYHRHPSARADEIAAAEQEAKAAGRGLWGPPCFGQTTSVPQ